MEFGPSIGLGEWVLIALLALLVVGPKDLPLMFRKLGRFVGQLRGMANEFRASFDEMARQSELDELRREVEALRTQTMRPLDGAFDPVDMTGATANPPTAKPAPAAAEPAATGDAAPTPALLVQPEPEPARTKAGEAA